MGDGVVVGVVVATEPLLITILVSGSGSALSGAGLCVGYVFFWGQLKTGVFLNVKGKVCVVVGV